MAPATDSHSPLREPGRGSSTTYQHDSTPSDRDPVGEDDSKPLLPTELQRDAAEGAHSAGVEPEWEQESEEAQPGRGLSRLQSLNMM